MSDTYGALPQSNALSEAQSDSLSELLTRDPEGYGEQDLQRAIEAYRQQRQKFLELEASGASKPKAATKVPMLASRSTATAL